MRSRQHAQTARAELAYGSDPTNARYRLAVLVEDLGALLDIVTRLTAERDEARAALRTLRGTHHERPPLSSRLRNLCRECAEFWPCETVRVIDGALGA